MRSTEGKRGLALLVGAVGILAVVAVGVQAGPGGGGTRVAFYGDSYTRGTGASETANRWSTIISEQRGWDEYNPSVDGLGFVNNRGPGGPDLPAQIIAEEPEIVFVTMGLNDNFSYESAAAQIKAQITTDFTALREGLPDARFIVVEPFWYTDSRPPSVDIIIGWVKDAAKEIDADYILGASHWIAGQVNLLADDGLHPNDDGYAEIARRMDAELAKLGLGRNN